MSEHDKPVTITKHNTFIQLGVAVAIAGFVFLAGATYEKVNRLDNIKIEDSLSMIRADLALIKYRLGLRSVPTLLPPFEQDVPDGHRTRASDEGPNVYR